jgi:hypothetical protein
VLSKAPARGTCLPDISHIPNVARIRERIDREAFWRDARFIVELRLGVRAKSPAHLGGTQSNPEHPGRFKARMLNRCHVVALSVDCATLSCNNALHGSAAQTWCPGALSCYEFIEAWAAGSRLERARLSVKSFNSGEGFG